MSKQSSPVQSSPVQSSPVQSSPVQSRINYCLVCETCFWSHTYHINKMFLNNRVRHQRLHFKSIHIKSSETGDWTAGLVSGLTFLFLVSESDLVSVVSQIKCLTQNLTLTKSNLLDSQIEKSHSGYVRPQTRVRPETDTQKAGNRKRVTTNFTDTS